MSNPMGIEMIICITSTLVYHFTVHTKPIMNNRLMKIQWNSFKEHFSSAFANSFGDASYADVTLVSDDLVPFKAHKFVLSSYSLIFNDLLQNQNHSHPLIYLNGIRRTVLEAILQFMYFGRTKIKSESVDEFFKALKELEVKQISRMSLEDMTKEQAWDAISSGYSLNHDIFPFIGIFIMNNVASDRKICS